MITCDNCGEDISEEGNYNLMTIHKSIRLCKKCYKDFVYISYKNLPKKIRDLDLMRRL